MTPYDFHPEAALDLAEIWDFIAEDSPGAADEVSGEIWPASKRWRRSRIKATDVRT